MIHHRAPRAKQGRSEGSPLCAWLVGDRKWALWGVTSQLLEVGFRGVSVEPTWELHLAGQGPLPDLVVAQHSPPHRDGIGCVRQVRRLCDVPLILLSTAVSIVDCERAMREGANRFLPQEEVGRIGDIGRDLAGGVSEVCSGEVPPIRTAAAARTLRDRELHDQLLRLMLAAGGNIAEMARQLGKDPSTVRYHLARFGMLGRSGRIPPNRRPSRASRQ
jgi:DNA-binding NarL/FixJ family response regulator